ncbi:hypothetical protein L211DRAFT_67443 [Terfezia boudieri ATCC MYA-4762]|uniref:Uncharacterized protein n=1 Tax=Terfezia boudieri ATCC MYA-4762 TaxID=1051890 RepID=A0A3N4LSW0_9PEZI|nr:hypothetical protein L211DRAFT_67443 [Terfezia boudieri ATCC MYA-4762]
MKMPLSIIAILQAGIPQSMQQPTDSEATSEFCELMNLYLQRYRHSQKLFRSLMTLLHFSFPYSQRPLKVLDTVEAVLQAREGLKHYRATTKVQKQLRDFWPLGRFRLIYFYVVIL